jgi:hypothetical protein
MNERFIRLALIQTCRRFLFNFIHRDIHNAKLAKISSRGQKGAGKLRRQIRQLNFSALKPLSIKAFYNPAAASGGLASPLLKAVCR